jgi:hypothetical protein
MSARLNFNEIPIVSWKGKTFSQITSSIQKNGKTQTTIDSTLLFKPLPLKIYRKEIAINVPSTNNRRVSIDELSMPNGSINNTNIHTGQCNTLDDNLINNTSDYPNVNANCNNASAVILSPAENAKRRVRSSGMIKKQYDISKNNDAYYTSTNQYLVGRNRTFQQNQYNYIRQGNANSPAGTPLSSSNVYSPQGINHCQKYQMDATSFSYKWIDGNTYDVSFPGGYYSVEDLNSVFKQAMITNYHYFILSPNNASIFVGTQLVNLEAYIGLKNIAFLMNIGFNSDTNKVELQVMEADSARLTTAIVTVPTIPAGLVDWKPNFNLIPKAPTFIITDSVFGMATGFSLGNYPNETSTTDQTFVSSFAPGIQSLYVKLYYKPNNPQFAQQGAVSSSALTLRTKYDSIQNSSSLYRKAYGTSVANALSYGVSEAGYTNKDKMGYPNKKTPVFSKYWDGMRVCSLNKLSHEV